MPLPRIPRVPRFFATAALLALAPPAPAADPATNEAPDPAPLLRRLRDDAERFDPAYDADIELEARRRAERNARDAAHPGEGYVPFDEVRSWSPTNDAQLRIQRTIARAGQALAARTESDAAARIANAGLPRPLERAVLAETAFCRLTNTLHATTVREKVPAEASVARLRRMVLLDRDDPRFTAALASRYLRRALAVPDGWRPDMDWEAAHPFETFDSFRFELVGYLLLHPGIRDSQVTWFRVAAKAGAERRLRDAASNLLVRAGANPSYERVGPMFASGESLVHLSFSTHYMMLLGPLENDASRAVLNDGREDRIRFSSELARLCRFQTPEETKELDDLLMIQICLDTGETAELDDAIARRTISPSLVKITDNGVPAPGDPVDAVPPPRENGIDYRQWPLRILARPAELDAAADADAWKAYFTRKGVGWPQGSELRLRADLGILYAANTRENLDYIDALFDALDAVPAAPQ